MRILCTGFEPFGGSPINPSAEALSRLTAPRGVELMPLVLPVTGRTAPRRLLASFDRCRPDAVVLLGESGRASALTIERVAINLRDYRIPDNAGVQVRDRPVVAGGPAAYFATLPCRKLEAALEMAGVPVELSDSAGTFLCNEVLYALLHHAARKRRPPPIGFIHLPRLPEQAGARHPSMPLDIVLRGLERILSVLAKTR